MGARRNSGGEAEWLTLGQAAKFLGVAQSTIRKWSDEGKVRAFYTPGRHRRFLRADLAAFVERSGPDGGGQGPLVLVVDDNDELRALVRVSLEDEGYSVREAANAEEALAAAEHQAPDLVLLDVVLPGVDGWEILRRLQERHGSIPVVMFSGQVDEPSADAAALGASDFLGKPFDPQQLVERARRILPV